MTNLPAVPDGSSIDQYRKAKKPEARAQAAAFMMEHVAGDPFPRTSPRFMYELPYIGDDDEVQERIAARLLLAEDPDKATDEAGTVKSANLVNQTIVVHEIRAAVSGMDNGWGAYLLADVTVVDTGERIVMNTGAAQVIVRLARAWAEGQLPLTGSVAAISGTGKGRNPALTFIAEPDL